MKLVVDLNRCQGYGQCVYAAPAVFSLHGVEALVYDPAPGEAQLFDVARAVNACPVRAITAISDEVAAPSEIFSGAGRP